MKEASRCAGWVAVLVVAACAAALCAEAGSPAAPESVVWGEAIAMPWDEQPVEGTSPETLLNTALDLTRRGEAGEVRTYETRRVNLTCGRRGELVNRVVSEARVRRTLLEEIGPNVWRERIEWERFGWGMAAGADQYPVVADFPGAQGTAYDFTPGEFEHVNVPADFERVGDPMIGYQMKVLAMDVHTWDGLIHSLREDVGSRIAIGAALRAGMQGAASISEVGGEGEVGTYDFGESTLTMAGVTRCQGEPCALIWYAADGNRVRQKLSNPSIAIEMDGAEYFRALIAVSLRDGHLVAGELWGPIVMEMKLGFDGEAPTIQPMSAIVGSVSIWEVSSTESASVAGAE
jgi:hypothetical protein